MSGVATVDKFLLWFGFSSPEISFVHLFHFDFCNKKVAYESYYKERKRNEF